MKEQFLKASCCGDEIKLEVSFGTQGKQGERGEKGEAGEKGDAGGGLTYKDIDHNTIFLNGNNELTNNAVITKDSSVIIVESSTKDLYSKREEANYKSANHETDARRNLRLNSSGSFEIIDFISVDDVFMDKKTFKTELQRDRIEHSLKTQHGNIFEFVKEMGTKGVFKVFDKDVPLLDSDNKLPNENLNFGKVEDGNKNIVSGGEVVNKTVLPNDIGLKKFNIGDNILKYSNFNNQLEFLVGKTVNSSGNYINSALWKSTDQPVKEGTHETNLYLTSLTALVTLDSNGKVVNYYSGKGTSNGLTTWSFITNSIEKTIRFCINNSQLTKDLPNSIYITTLTSYSQATSNVFISSEEMKTSDIGVRYFSYHDNIYKYSDFNNNLEFVPNQLVTATGNILLGNNYKSTRQPIRAGIHVTNQYLTASIALVTLDKNGNVVNSYSAKGTPDGLTPWVFTTNELEVEVLTCIHNSQLTKDLPNSIYITSANNYQIIVNSKFKLNKQAYLNKEIGVSLGDSVTQYGNYPDILAYYVGVNFKNLGVGGTNLTDNGSTTDLGALSFCRWADAINSDNFSLINTALDNLISSTTGQTSMRHQRAKNNLASTEWAKVKYLTVFFGTNDYASSRLLGDINLDNFNKDTIVGAVNYGVDKIQSKYPDIKIFFITPTHRFMTTEYVRAQDSDFRVNLNGDKLIQYAEVIEVASNLNHLPCKNMYKEGFFNRFNHSKYFVDGVHPNNLGFELIGNTLSSFIESKIKT